MTRRKMTNYTTYLRYCRVVKKGGILLGQVRRFRKVRLPFWRTVRRWNTGRDNEVLAKFWAEEEERKQILLRF